MLQHFTRKIERVRNAQFVRVGFAEILFIDDKTTADRIVSLAVNLFIPGEGVDLHAVLMQRQVIAAEHHAAVTREIYLMQAAGQHQSLTLFYIANKTRDAIDINGIRHIARQAEDDSDIGMVTFTGQ
ncbi:hypothetical protein D3C87_1522510 [compost metagenome]